MARRLAPVERYGLRLTLLAVAVVLIAVPFSFLLLQVLAEGPLTRFDGALADRLNDLVQGVPFVVGALVVVSAFGTPPALWLVTGVSVVFALRHRVPRLALFLVATTLGGGIVSTAIKVLVDRPRPEVDHPIVTAFGKSFPSGHALSSTVVYGAVLLAFLPMLPRARRHLAVGVVAALVLMIGASRLLLGVHFLTDVVAGHILGLAWLCGAVAAFEVFRIERGRRPSAPLDEGVEPEAAAALKS